MTRLEARIRDATYEAEDIIELHMSNPILSESATHEAEDKIELHMSKEILSESATYEAVDIIDMSKDILSESATYEAVDIMDMSKDILSDIIDLHKSKEILSESATYKAVDVIDMSKEILSKPATYEAVDIIDMSKEILSKPATYEAVDIIDMSKEILSESATYEAVDVIDLHMSEEILFKDLVELHMSKQIPLFHNSEKYEGLQKAIKEIDSNLVDAKKMNDIEGLLKSSSSNKSAVVGFDNDLMQISDPLSGLPPEFKSTSIVGIEDIEEVVNAKDRNDILDLQPRTSLHATTSKSASANKNSMVGFKDDLLQIKEELVGQPSRLKFISIVGMGGIGKATLASNIYNDSYIKEHFYMRAWTTPSQEYRVQELLIHLLKSMGDLTEEMIRKETDELKTLVFQRLKGNRYLIVMDDVWDAKVLDEFRRIFPDDCNGSRIILTSRLSSVIVNADSSAYIHRVSFLNPKQSLSLLCQKAFGNECCPPELEEIGMRIVEKCKGLPLALVVIGGVLYKAEKTRANWEYVAKM
ncbi:late blight resistance homolog R1A-10 isoform X1 [Olea europaea subsp. europaea]|uniref:Late blight resistance homolog R1A-10 isoform X1 n=1 Tax=Olea europaea subsp. europaea TaxID=158383 RepID=A0A8S0V7A0_OLEEU|nr:late blight resistance homolog R1A-10 isoform X1 [Olea europaea subsp. europaea]